MAAIHEIGQYLGKVPLDASGRNTAGPIQNLGFKHLRPAENVKAKGEIIAAERQLLARIGIRGDATSQSQPNHKAFGVNIAVPGTPRNLE